MSTEQAYITGFVKRAHEYGFTTNEALNIYKQANTPPSMEGYRGMAGGTDWVPTPRSANSAMVPSGGSGAGSQLALPSGAGSQLAIRGGANTASPQLALPSSAGSQLATRGVSPIPDMAAGALPRGYKPPTVEGRLASPSRGLMGRAMAGAGVGMGLNSAYNRAKGGDIKGALIDGVGALGAGAAVSKNPLIRGIGTAASVGSMGLNAYLDHKNAPQGAAAPGAPASPGGTMPPAGPQQPAAQGAPGTPGAAAASSNPGAMMPAGPSAMPSRQSAMMASPGAENSAGAAEQPHPDIARLGKPGPSSMAQAAQDAVSGTRLENGSITTGPGLGVSTAPGGGARPQAAPRAQPQRMPASHAARSSVSGPSNAYLSKVMGSYDPNSRLDRQKADRVRQMYSPGMNANQIYRDSQYNSIR